MLVVVNGDGDNAEISRIFLDSIVEMCGIEGTDVHKKSRAVYSDGSGQDKNDLYYNTAKFLDYFPVGHARRHQKQAV